MGNIIAESLEHIGHIDDDGYIFDQSYSCVAKINDSGYIVEIGGSEIFGKIDVDGTIRDASLDVIGRIQADGYVYIHSRRICRVSSEFIETITPAAWNAGETSTYSGRKRSTGYRESNASSNSSFNFFFSPFFIKLMIGIVLGIIAMVNGWGSGGIEMLLVCPIAIFLFSFIAKFFGSF